MHVNPLQSAVLSATFQCHAVFLDLDGTLADIAERPSGATVHASTIATLDRLHKNLGGALAIVSGREIDDVDRLLTPSRFPVAGVHGAARRTGNGNILTRGLSRELIATLATTLKNELAITAQDVSGILIEEKSAAVAVHYRSRPDLAVLCEQAVMALVDAHSGLRYQPGKMVCEIVAADIDKGGAINAFLAESPFAGRRPFFAGDDLTDEAGFAAVNARDGVSIKIGGGYTLAKYRLAGPADVRALLTQWAQDSERA